MKLPIKYIAILVIVALVGVFSYQTYWLVGLYQSQKKEMDEKVNLALSYAHIMEMEKRVEKLRSADNAPHKRLEANVGVAMDDEDSTSKLRKVKKVSGGRTITEVYSDSDSSHGETMASNDTQKNANGENVSDGTQEQTLMLMISGKLNTLVQQALFSKLNELAAPDIQVFDSLLVHKLISDSLMTISPSGKEEIPHQVQFIQGKKVKEKVVSSGYVQSSHAVQYQYVVCNEGESNEEKYVLTMEPLTMAVLKQMAGILITSLIIMLILGFAFWYLIHTMLKQKTLDEMKSDFTNNITHELKTPIAVAYAANDAMLNYGMIQHPDKARSYLGIIQEQLQRLSGMVEQILAMSMERRKTMQLHIVDVNVKEALKILISQHELKVKSGEAEHKQVRFSLSVEPDDLTIQADAMHFSNIVSNLIDNAIKYSGVCVEIRIHATRQCITVADNGIGIAHDKLPYIFDKFYRVTDGNKYNVKGYGLGLFYVKSLMEKMGGSVSVESEIGKGTIFRLNIK